MRRDLLEELHARAQRARVEKDVLRPEPPFELAVQRGRRERHVLVAVIDEYPHPFHGAADPTPTRVRRPALCTLAGM